MSDLFLKVILALAYGPILVMAVLWLAALLLAAGGERRFLDWLNRRTHWGEQSPR